MVSVNSADVDGDGDEVRRHVRPRCVQHPEPNS
jgi:hypothetical protein